MDTQTIAHCTIWYQFIQIRKEDEPRYEPMITVFLCDREQHPELEARLLQYSKE